MAEKDEKKLSKAQLMSRYYNEMKKKAPNPEQVRQGLSKNLSGIDPEELKALLKRLEEMPEPSEEDVSRAAEALGVEKKYTGGKVGDKYYGGGPVYPRPTKDS
tara:strand:- start:227 stop:535 length:309 start_codon:yes stop_codon:yes gene_type:complete